MFHVHLQLLKDREFVIWNGTVVVPSIYPLPKLHSLDRHTYGAQLARIGLTLQARIVRCVREENVDLDDLLNVGTSSLQDGSHVLDALVLDVPSVVFSLVT